MEEHAAIVIRDDKNKILFIKRSMKKKTLPGKWSFPSGTVEKGESIFETVMREAKEELGIDVEIEKIFAQKELPEFNVGLKFVLCSAKNKIPKIQDYNEIEKFEWINFPDFFRRFSDEEIGHGLIWLRKNPNLWEEN